MRILVITKRQCVGRDILDDRYWRLFEIPEHLHSLGHVASGLALSYRYRPEGIFEFHEATQTQWESLNAVPVVPYKLWRYRRHLQHLLDTFKPDLVWASSDALHAIAAWRTCPPRKIPFVIDLYDNYESFGLTKLPGVANLLRAACRHANGLTLISNTLNDYVGEHYNLPPAIPRLVLGNAVDALKFRPIAKADARKALGLPANALLIGTAGAIQANRGIETLIEAFAHLAQSFPALQLVLAGPKDQTLERLAQPGITYLGILPPNTVPLFWNALDVAIVPNKNSTFGRYCYPQKLQEIIACGTPFVATGVGEVSILLHQSDCLVPPESADAMAKAIALQIKHPTPMANTLVQTWNDRAIALSKFFETVIRQAVY